MLEESRGQMYSVPMTGHIRWDPPMKVLLISAAFLQTIIILKLTIPAVLMFITNVNRFMTLMIISKVLMNIYPTAV